MNTTEQRRPRGVSFDMQPQMTQRNESFDATRPRIDSTGLGRPRIDSNVDLGGRLDPPTPENSSGPPKSTFSSTMATTATTATTAGGKTRYAIIIIIINYTYTYTYTRYDSREDLIADRRREETEAHHQKQQQQQ